MSAAEEARLEALEERRVNELLLRAGAADLVVSDGLRGLLGLAWRQGRIDKGEEILAAMGGAA